MLSEKTAPTFQSRITRLGHSCVLVELPTRTGAVRRLILDPGNLTPSLAEVSDVDAVLVTHAHPDHIDPAQLAALARNRAFPVYGAKGLASHLADAGVGDVIELEPGDHEVVGVPVRVGFAPHEVIHPELALPTNLTFEIGGVFAPGDAFAVPDRPVDVLLAPTGAPWMKLHETITYVAEVAPRRVIPVHDAGLAPAHRMLHTSLMTKFAPAGTEVHVLDIGGVLRL